MSDITTIRQVNASEIADKVTSYWTRRAPSFSEIRHDEAHSYRSEMWRMELGARLPHDGIIRILDVGCGTGFFEMVLAPLGHNITGIDLTPQMIEEGNKLLAGHGVTNAELQVMDAQNLEFSDESFDAVISRNLTWNLPQPEKAYTEWYRVLKPGGILLNYDAEYAKGFHQYDQAENCAHQGLGDSLIEDCHEMYHMLPISTWERPEWDVRTLNNIGFSKVDTDLGAGDRLYGIKDKFYMPDRMFLISAIK